jgi:hypothetical protein
MGDRFNLTLDCAYCGAKNSVFYAPTCGFYDFTCGLNPDDDYPICEPEGSGQYTGYAKTMGCGKTNFITADFRVKQIEDVIEEDIIQAFEMASNAYHKPEAIKKEAKQYLKDLKKRVENGHAGN